VIFISRSGRTTYEHITSLPTYSASYPPCRGGHNACQGVAAGRQPVSAPKPMNLLRKKVRKIYRANFLHPSGGVRARLVGAGSPWRRQMIDAPSRGKRRAALRPTFAGLRPDPWRATKNRSWRILAPLRGIPARGRAAHSRPMSSEHPANRRRRAAKSPHFAKSPRQNCLKSAF
jgi:hypothetical protein